jgi:hypothetical protein
MKADYSVSVPMASARTARAGLMEARAKVAFWDVPVEMALACSSSAFKSVIWARYGQGEHPAPNARVIVSGSRFFATISFPGHHDMHLPLDCWTMENGR